MSQLRKTINKKRPSLLCDKFTSLDNINSDQPSTPIVPSSSRNMFTMDNKAPRSLISSPLPSRIKDDSYSVLCSPTNSLRQITKLKKDMKILGSANRLENEDKKINQLELEKVFGFTIQSNACVALDPITGIIAFPAGCVIVGYSAKRSKQFFIHNTVKSPITSLAFSKDGKLLATGESGKLPKVRIWNVNSRTQILQFNGHNYKVGAVTFSPDSRFVVSVGSQEDMTINVWDIGSNLRMATSRVTSKINAVAFSESGQYFVTVGVRHVRFWYLDNSRSKSRSTMVLSGRNALLGDFMNNTFNDVGCSSSVSNFGLDSLGSSTFSSFNSSHSQSYVYVISQAGQLMQFNEQRSLEKWVELQTPKATCLTVCESYIMVGCSRGIIHMFDTVSLSHLATLPTPHFVGVNLNTGNVDQSIKYHPFRYPDVIAGKYDYIHSRITYFYNDHSLYVWDVQDIQNPVKVASHLFHSGGVWSVEPVPLSYGNDTGILDVCSFLTCSDDETIRFWNLKDSSHRSKRSQNVKLPSNLSNDISKELLWIIYADPYLRCLTESDRLLVKSNHQTNDSNSILKHGIRSSKLSPDRSHLATADREGNLRFYSTLDFSELYSIIAHNGEILSIDYFQSPSVPDLILFCSASRDRVIHIMDPCQAYKCIQTIDDHSGAIFSAKLVETPSDQEIRLVSCGMDKSILFRILQPDESGQTAQFFLNQHLVGKHSQYDMAIAPNNRYAAVACQDRQVRIYNLVTGKQRKSYRGTTAEDGNLLRCAIDPSGTYLATSGSDKNLHVLNFTTGEILASVTGHSEMASGICFLCDLKHLVSVSSDNCIFVWRLPAEMTLIMQRRMKELGSPNLDHLSDFNINKGTASASTCGTVTPPRMSDDTNVGSSNISICTTASGDNLDNGSPSTFRFSVSALPSWAQRKFSRRDSITFVQVNLLNDFCSGMSTVIERTEENIFFEDNKRKEDVTSRRMSFIATEKVVRDDDSDNVDEEDSEWFSGEKDNFHRSELDTISQQLSTEDENDDDDEEEFVILNEKTPIKKNTEGTNSKFVIQTNTKGTEDDYSDLLCSSAPPPLDNLMYQKMDDSGRTILNRNNSVPTSHFSFDDIPYPEDGAFINLKRRSSLTTRYLSIYPPGSNIDNIERLSDHGSSDESKEKPEATIVAAYVVMPKSMSPNDVPHLATNRRTSELTNRSANMTSSKVHIPSNSQDGRTTDNKSLPRKNIKKGCFNRSISTSSVAPSDNFVESRPRSNKPIYQSQASNEMKFNTNPPVIDTSGKSARPKWSNSKRTKTVHRTCPVDIKDIRDMYSKHSCTKNITTNEISLANIDNNNVDIDQYKDSNVENVNKQNLTETTSIELHSDRGKEHVIDEIEEMPAPTLPLDSNNNCRVSLFKNQEKMLRLKNQEDNRELLSDFLDVNTIVSTDKESVTCSDAWIDDLFRTHSTQFLASMAPKLLRRLIHNFQADNESHRQATRQLLFEVEGIYQKQKISLNTVPLPLDNDVSASLIKDIGERIIDEVKRRLSESR